MIVSVHLGLRWPLIMGVARTAFRLRPSPARATVLRLLALLIAVLGLRSATELGLPAKLTMQISIEFWDFSESTIGFFWRLAALIGLLITVTHGTMHLLQSTRRSAMTPAPAVRPGRAAPPAPPPR